MLGERRGIAVILLESLQPTLEDRLQQLRPRHGVASGPWRAHQALKTALQEDSRRPVLSKGTRAQATSVLGSLENSSKTLGFVSCTLSPRTSKRV